MPDASPASGTSRTPPGSSGPSDPRAARTVVPAAIRRSVLFSSYYHGIGAQHARPQRGLVTRPGLAEVRDYRRAVDERISRCSTSGPAPELLQMLTLGLPRAAAPGKLILTDLLHLLVQSAGAGLPAAHGPDAPSTAAPLTWIARPGGRSRSVTGAMASRSTTRRRGTCGSSAPRLADRLVTQGEWPEFIGDGGYRDPRWWLSAGWDWVRARSCRGDAAGAGATTATARGASSRSPARAPSIRTRRSFTSVCTRLMPTPAGPACARTSPADAVCPPRPSGKRPRRKSNQCDRRR